MADSGSPVGALAVRIGADASELVSELGKAQKSVDKFADGFEFAAKTAATLGAALAGTTTAVLAMVHAASENADAMYKQAQAAGVAVTTFSEYAYVAKLSNISNETLTASLAKLNKHLFETASGSGESAKAFAALGINAKNADGSLKSADQVIEEIADQFAGMEDGAAKSALAMEFFGKSGAQMIPMLNEGARAIREARQEAHDLGVTIDSETGKAAQAFNDNLTRLSQVGQGFANSLMMEMLPALNQITDALVKVGKESGGTRDSFAELVASGLVTVFQTLAVVGSDVAFVFKMVGGELGVIAAQTAALARGDWQGFKLIGEQWTKDAEQARKDLDDFQKRVMDLKTATQAKPGEGGAMDMGIGLDFMKGKKAGPIIDQKQSDETKKLLDQDLANVIKSAEAIQAQDDATQRAIVEAQQKAAEQRIALSQQVANQIANQYLSEQELAEQNFTKQAELLQKAADAGAITQERANELRVLMEERLQNQLSDIYKKGLSDREKFTAKSYYEQSKTIFSELASVTAGVAQHNRALFEINKVAGIANAIISTYEGAARALAVYPPPLSFVMAAAQVAAGLAQVQAIRSTSFSGGGAGGGGGAIAPSVAGTAAATPVTQTEQTRERQATIVQIVGGDMFSGKQVRSLIEKLNENMADGGRIILQ